MNDYDYFCSQLKQLRKKNNLTQKQVSKCMKFSTPQFVSNFERGLCLPGIRSLKKLSLLYKIEIYDLFDMFMDAKRSQYLKQLKKQRI